MDVAFLFNFGFLATILQIHLTNFGLNQIFIALCFVLESITYISTSLSAGKILKNVDERTSMMFGTIFCGISYLMLGPCAYIFPKNVYVIVLSLPIFGLGQTLTYSDF